MWLGRYMNAQHPGSAGSLLLNADLNIVRSANLSQSAVRFMHLRVPRALCLKGFTFEFCRALPFSESTLPFEFCYDSRFLKE